jgi:putative ABC transport system permease protein
MLGFTPQLWTPLVLNEADQSAAVRKDRSLYLFARMKNGTTLEQARAEMVTVGRHTEQSFPETEKGWGVAVRTLPDFLIYSLGARTGIDVLMTAVGFVLLIACANVAGLLLARASGRRRELAVRVALGAGRSRIVRQLLTEGLLIAILGGSTGLLLAYWGIDFMRANLAFNEVIEAVPLSLDWNVVLFALGVSLVSALLCGIAPAWRASRTEVNISLNSESRSVSGGRARSRLRMVLVTGEIAMALFLLVGVGLLIRGIYVIEHQNLGFRAEHLLTANLTLDDTRYKDAEKKKVFVRDVLARLQKAPGAEAAAGTSDLPASGLRSVPLRIKNQPELPAEQKLTAFDFVVTPEYFRATGIPLVLGRAFTEMDNATTPAVVVVNQEFAHRYLQGKEPLGQQIQLEVGDAAPRWSQIVGIAGNIKTYSEESRYDPEVYEPYFQRPVASFSLVVRAISDPNALTSSLRDAVGKVDVELPLSRLMSMPALIDRQRAANPFVERALGTFALLALILATIGIYGLIAFSVDQRMQEIGIRMALGANGSSVLRMILWDGGKMNAIGAFMGLAMALPLPKLFDSILYGIHSSEPWLYLIVPMALFAVAMLAAYIPARRAMRVDPLIALRYE